MSISFAIAEEYFEKTQTPTLNDFLKYSYEKMFCAYLIKTVEMTRTHYFVKQKKELVVPTQPEYFTDSQLLSHTDTYECDFHDLIKVLTKRQQTILVMCFELGYCENAVAKKLRITPQAVHGLKNRAFNALRKELYREC